MNLSGSIDWKLSFDLQFSLETVVSTFVESAPHNEMQTPRSPESGPNYRLIRNINPANRDFVLQSVPAFCARG